MDVSEKNYVDKCLLTMFLTEDEVLMGKDTDQNIRSRSITLLIFGQQCTGRTGPAPAPTPAVHHTRGRWWTYWVRPGRYDRNHMWATSVTPKISDKR